MTLLSDAVTDITKRAVEPTLAPFGAELRETIAALDVRLRTLDELLGDDRADRLRLSSQVGDLVRTTASGTDQLRERIDIATLSLDDLRSQATENSATIEKLRRFALGLSVALLLALAALGVVVLGWG
ncbi:hypothetical protein [Cryptosporangium phraense]|uniref:Uncharacterized protein n=1 Tax=Cryptosporangium phraense TaxID=2593070 RepID=A0A545ATU0_9ACTN|nr:hypothetical protein [Cryptosporangium phraense]TQS44757.1 hypothetical protein FL583_12385 [Cryptosporangium phraense]